MLNDFLDFLIEKDYAVLPKNHKEEVIDEYLNEEEVIE